MADLMGFDATQVAPDMGFTVIPAGKYRAAIVKSDNKPTKSGTGSYVELQFEVLSGEHKGARVTARLNLQNPNAQAVQIARAELSAICHAVNVMKPSDSSQLHNIPLVITVSVREYTKNDGEKGQQNEIKKYESTEAASAAHQAAQSLPEQPAREKAPWE